VRKVAESVQFTN